MNTALKTMSALMLAVGMAIGGSGTAGAEKISDKAEFALVVRGITAGTLNFAATQNDAGYAVQGKLVSSGMAAFIRKVRYDARAQGSISDGRYTPTKYTEEADTGKRQSESTMEYVGGVPQVKLYKPARKARPSDVDPATQGGTVDPLTAMYATLRDVAAGQECQVDVRMFDGRRASAISLGKPKTEGDRVTCTGEYRRVAGFSDEDMAEKTRFAFQLTYAPAGEGRMQVVEVAMDSLFGPARMVRQ